MHFDADQKSIKRIMISSQELFQTEVYGVISFDALLLEKN